jgi:hypothetical protein
MFIRSLCLLAVLLAAVNGIASRNSPLSPSLLFVYLFVCIFILSKRLVFPFFFSLFILFYLAAVFKVAVGPPGTFSFVPQNVTIQVGDVVSYVSRLLLFLFIIFTFISHFLFLFILFMYLFLC